MARESVRKALDGRLATYTPVEGMVLLIAWENVDFEPVIGTPYIAQKDLAARPNILGIGVNAPTQYIGTYSLKVFYPSGKGSGRASRQADALAEHFKRGTPLSADGLPVRIPRTWKGPLQQRDEWIFYPVDVEYSAEEYP